MYGKRNCEKIQGYQKAGNQKRNRSFEKNNEQLFKLWAYDKSIDVDFLKKQARENLLKLEENEKMYAATANETPDVNLAMRYLNSRNIPF